MKDLNSEEQVMVYGELYEELSRGKLSEGACIVLKEMIYEEYLKSYKQLPKSMKDKEKFKLIPKSIEERINDDARKEKAAKKR